MKVREFGELEAAIMDALWSADRALAVREIRETMTYDRDVAYTTVMTVANILFNKGMLHREKVGRAWRYRPRESREEHTARVMSEVLSGGGDRGATMVRLIERFSDEEMSRLHEALAEIRLRRGIAS
ncbi:putative transcriptional regulator [Thermobifida halotolerans]|uniref:BlaI/MecI/CopY family transcriptional regulator n=1 Tax=Thermobifida halotolerans TaxID=483545 RepID=UPI000838C22B